MVPSDERLNALRAIVLGHDHERHCRVNAVVLIKTLQRWHLLDTAWTPCASEVDQHDLALQFTQPVEPAIQASVLKVWSPLR